MGIQNSQIQDQVQLMRIHNKPKIVSYNRVLQEEEMCKVRQQPITDQSNGKSVQQKPISILKIPSLRQVMKQRSENYDVKKENFGSIGSTPKSKKLQNEQESKVLNLQSSPSPKQFKEINVPIERKAQKEEQKEEIAKKQIIEKSPIKSPKLNKAKLNNPIRKELQRVYDL